MRDRILKLYKSQIGCFCVPALGSGSPVVLKVRLSFEKKVVRIKETAIGPSDLFK